ncbi:hypothetical protein [Arthrobacter sp. MP_2.3]|uniref:hypothetical protein n=1 Tax=Arthrobacter sp. MP_2.3 TaxID=3349633 RepID=UPI0038D49C9F
MDAVRSITPSERAAQVRARDRDTLRTIEELAGNEGSLAEATLTRRQLRLLQLAAEAATATPGAPGAAGMTVEQALAARELLARQAQNQLAKMNHINATDINATDSGATDSGAANSGAADADPAGPQAEPTGKPGPGSRLEPERADPATAFNLAMVTPLEFVRVPGIERPVMKRPATSHIPVISVPATTVPGSRVEPSRTSESLRTSSSSEAEPSQAGAAPATGAGPADPSVTDDTARAPVAANAAYGLDPLDADTAGLGRARRLRIAQFAVLGLGMIALVIGLILVITGFSG